MSYRLPGMMRYRNERLWDNKLTDSIFPNSTSYNKQTGKNVPGVGLPKRSFLSRYLQSSW